MTYNRLMILVLAFSFVLHLIVLHPVSWGHGLHLTHEGKPTVQVIPESFTGMTFETVTGKCYVITKERHEVLTYPTTLHIREIACVND